MGRAFEFRKGRKMKRWASMSKIFTRIGKDISMAVKEAGPNPEANSKLRAIIQNAKAANMPKDNVERAIAKASGKDAAEYKEVVYEGYGPHKIAVVIETQTDNPTRTVANIRSYFNKTGGALGLTGSLDFLFDRKSIFKINSAGINMEELEFDLIDAGLEEIGEEDDHIVIYGGFESFKAIQTALEEKGIEIVSSEFERIPTSFKEVTEEQRADMEKLLEKLEEDDDVSNVFHNMAEE